MSKRLFAFLPLSLMLLSAPDYTFAAQRTEGSTSLAACYAEAQWPVIASSAYVYGNARQREQLANGSNPESYAMRRICYRIATESSEASQLTAQCGQLIADEMKHHGDTATAHARRQKVLCEQLSGQTAAIDGL